MSAKYICPRCGEVDPIATFSYIDGDQPECPDCGSLCSLSLTYNEFGVLAEEAQKVLDGSVDDLFKGIRFITDGASQLDLRLLSQEIQGRITNHIAELILLKSTKQRKGQKYNQRKQQVTAYKVAAEFAKQMHADLNPTQMETVIKRNKTDEYKNACASHDFIDANMTMDAAMRLMIPDYTGEPNQEETDIWNLAWDVAKGRDFDVEKLQELADKLEERFVKDFGKE